MADIWVNILGDGSKLKGELDKSNKNVTSFSEKIGKVGKIATAAGVAVTAAFTAIVLKTAAVGDQFDKMSLRTGVAVEDLSALAYAADISGSDIGTLEKGLKALTMVMDDASRGMGEGMIAFEELGISVLDNEGKLRSTVDVLKEAATKIAAIEDPTKQAALAMDLFGSRAGPQLLPLLKQGEVGIEALMAKAKELGIVVSTEAATAAAEFTDRLTDLKGSLFGAGRMIGDTLIPAITPLIEKATEIVVKISNWTKENAELTEKIFKWAAALGVTLAVLGPILVILPGLISGITLLSGAFLPFVIGGAIVLGIKKLSDYMGKIKIDAFEAATGFKDWPLDKLNKGISEVEKIISDLSAELAEAEKGFSIFGITLKNQDVNIERLKQVIKDYNIELGLLKKQKEELIKAEQAGIDVAGEKAKIDEEAKKLMDEIAEKTEEAREAIEDKTKAAELATAQMKIENDIYALTHSAIEVSIRDLDTLRQSYLDKGIAQEIVNEWYDLEIKKLKEVKVELEDNVSIMEEVARVTKAVEDRWFELTKLPYEVKIKNINEKYDDYIKVIKESNLSLLAQETAIRNINLARDLEIEGIDKTTEAEKTLAEATKNIQDRTLELTDSLAYSILKLDEQKEMFEKAGVEAKLIAEWYKLAREALEEPPDIDPWEEFFKNIKDSYSNTIGAMQTGISNFISASQTALGDAFYNILSGAKSFQDSMAELWRSIVDSVIMELARLAAFYVFKWIFGIPGLSAGGGASAGLGAGMKAVKGFQFGGMADTIPARLTIGEYVISKPMTDFIKRFRAFPTNLIDAIVKGMPTPVAPAFAGGGAVGSSNITTSSFGETKINIDIHDNRIASNIDIKRLAVTISDEVLRKIELKRRH